MRRLPTMMASALAAALTTLAVTIVVPAIADDGPAADAEDRFAACLRDHGVDGASGGAALKRRLGERLERGDATAERALAACSPKPVIVKAGPSAQEVRSCLDDHGVEVPGDDALALKRWVAEHADDAAYRDAMKACDLGPVTKSGIGRGCAKEGAVAMAIPAERPQKVATGATVHEFSDGD